MLLLSIAFFSASVGGLRDRWKGGSQWKKGLNHTTRKRKLDSMGVQYNPGTSASELKNLYDELKITTVDESKAESNTTAGTEI